MTTSASHPRNVAGWIYLTLILVTLAVYWPVTQYQFVSYDDTDFVTENSIVQAGLTAQGVQYAMRAEVARNWHPVTILSHMLDCQLFGLRAGWHHLTNLLLHVANTLLLFAVWRRMTGATWRSAAVAAWFAWHPLHVESVAWIAERKDVLSALFWWLTIWAYARYAEERNVPGASVKDSPAGNSKRGVFYGLALGFFALAAMSKPMVVTLPFVLLLLDFWPLKRMQFRAAAVPAIQQGRGRGKARPASAVSGSPPSLARLILEKAPFFVMSGVLAAVTFAAQKQGGAMLGGDNLPLGARLSNAVISYVRYGGKMLWPENLAGLYLRIGPWPVWEVAGAAALLVSVTVWVMKEWRRRPYLTTGWFWYLGTLVPVIGLVQVGMQTMADRYTYLPLVGLFIMLAWGAREMAVRFHLSARLAAGVTALVLGACLILTSRQIGYWKDSETLFTRMISATKDNYMAHYNLGNLYSREKKFDPALTNYEAAIAEQPAYAAAYNNLGGLLLGQKQYESAIANYAQAARLKPEYLQYFNLANALANAASARQNTNWFARAVQAYQQALQLNPDASEAHNNFGMTWEAQGRDDEAIAEYRAAVRARPDFELARFNLANALSRVGKLDEALAQYQEAQRLNPGRAESFNGAGLCDAREGKMEEAATQFRRAIALNPRDADAYGNLGNALGARNKVAEAIPFYLTALQLNPQDYQTQFNLALSLLRQGRRDEARTHFQAALRINPNYAPARQALSQLDAPAGH